MIMASITINIPDSQLQKLQELAKLYGISLEALLSASIEEWLSDQKTDFTNTANYVLKKNAELYRRLG
jgi:predicted transcriptional regulator